MRAARALLLCALVTVAGAARAADDAPPGGGHTWWGLKEWPRQWRPGEPRNPALEVPTPITHDEQVQQVTLKETIALALENNPGIAARRLEPLRQREGVLGAQAQFDPTFSGEFLSSQGRFPNQSALTQQRTLVVDDRTANFHLGKIFRPGTAVTIDFLNERLDNNASFNSLRPQYKPELNFSLVQPLLRSFGWDFTYLVVRVAEELADAARYDYEARLANFVELVIESYWSVVNARENVEVQRESKALADRTVDENTARVRVGLLARVAVLEAQADAKSREEQVLIAENDLAIALNRLSQVAYYRPDGTFVPRTLEPVEEPTPEDLAVDMEATLATALDARPEIHASARDVEAQVLNERIAGNGLLPRLDLVGSYGVNGLSGTNRPILRDTNIPGANCVQIRADPPLFSCTSSFGGPASEAYDRLSSNDFRSYSFGLQFQLPLSNALARSTYSQSRISRSQAELNHRDLLSQVTLEVRQSVSNVITSRQRIDTTRVARELADENLQNQQKRHDVGLATTKDLLDFQTRLTTARAAEVQAKTDHAVAVSRWRRAAGKLLAHYQIVLETPGRRGTPWFARF